MASSINRMSMRRLVAPLIRGNARGFHTTPSPLAPVAVRKATPKTSTATATTAQPAPTSDFDDVFNDPPASSPSKASTSTSSAATEGSKVSPPLSALPNENYQSLPGTEGMTGGIPGEQHQNWGTSFAGLSTEPFPEKAREVLMKPLEPNDVEMKPDGMIYMPEIKYRRVLNMAFGPGGWGLAPRGETHIANKVVSREWGLICLGRLVAVARGEQVYFDEAGIATATEAAKSNALMRCCKDLGIAYELWDPSFIRDFKKKYCKEVFVENVTTKKKKKMWRMKDGPKFEYPWKET